MEYVYSAMLLHSAKKQISEDSVKKVIAAAGISPDEGKIKALVASLKEINIDDAIQKAATATVAVVPPQAGATTGHAKAKEEAPKEEKKTEEEAAAGLGSLFG